MTDTHEAVEKRKRRTAAERRAFHLEEAKKAEEQEKADVLRLLSEAHDTMTEAMSLEAHKPHAQACNQTLQLLKTLINAFTPPKK